jgi:hypothetical protein
LVAAVLGLVEIGAEEALDQRLEVQWTGRLSRGQFPQAEIRQFIRPPLNRLREKLGLAAAVMMHQPDLRIRGCGDISDRGTVEAPVRENPFRCVKDSRP